MHCSNCGAEAFIGYNFCSECGDKIGNSSPITQTCEGIYVSYAGFWIRLLAYVIDSFIIGIPLVIFTSIIFGFQWVFDFGSADLFHNLVYMLVIVLLWVNWEGQTPGKKILGIRIIGPNINQIGYGRAILRYLGYIICGLTLGIGFIMIGFHGKKRGLHDLIADTYVIKD